MVILCKPTQAVWDNGIPLYMTSRHDAIRKKALTCALSSVVCDLICNTIVDCWLLLKRTSSAWGLPYTYVSIIPINTKTFSIICSPGSRLGIVYMKLLSTHAILGYIQESVWYAVNLTWFKLCYKLNHISPYTVVPNPGLYHWVIVNIHLKDQKMITKDSKLYY